MIKKTIPTIKNTITSICCVIPNVFNPGIPPVLALSTINVIIKGLLSGAAGFGSGLIRGGYNARNAKNFKDMASAASKGAKGAIDARDKRAAYKATHGGTIFGSMEGHAARPVARSTRSEVKASLSTKSLKSVIASCPFIYFSINARVMSL